MRSGSHIMPQAHGGLVLALIPALPLLATQLACAQLQSGATGVEVLLSQASAMEQRKDYVGAEKAYRQALQAAPDDPEILMRLGVVYQMDLRYDDSLEAFQQILKRAPRYPGANRLMGISYFGLNRFAEAEKSLRGELVANPKDREARYYLALDLNSLGRIAEAIHELETLVADDPKDAPVLYQLTLYYKAAAEQAAHRLNELSPDSEWTHALKAQVLEDQQQTDAAIREFEEVLRKNPGFPGIHFGLGQAYWIKKDLVHAQEQLTLALQEDPEQPLANYYLADLLTDNKQFQDAIPHLRITIAAYPQMTRAYFLLGKCYAGTGNPQASLKAFDKALALDPNSKDVHYQLYELYARLGEKTESQKHLALFEQLTKQGQENDRTLLQKLQEKSAASKDDK
ncbi:MAG TPA: tetratricopeptide repeat protein [Terriglobia bacterium]|nr:tetratricopeptide repeat protein [Terriglobia bacterium]